MEFYNSFASHPKSKFLSEGQLSPKLIQKNSRCKYWFDCKKCGHEFDASPNNIINGSWCPYCANRKLCDNEACKICFEKSFASNEKSKYWSDKNAKKTRDVFLNARNKYFFKCDICNHIFDIRLDSIFSQYESWCPYCVNKKLCDEKDCKLCSEKSFASHEKSKWWSDENKKSPREVFKGSSNNYKFNCDKCTHFFMKKPSSISGNKKAWCPYCANQKLCEDKKCESCFEKSFASHEKIELWSENNITNPRNVFKGSRSKYEFKCNICQLYFYKCLSSMTNKNKINGCPKCKNKTEKKIYDWLLLYDSKTIHQYKIKWLKSPLTRRFLPFDFFIPKVNIILEVDGDQHFRQVSNWDSHKHTQSKDLYKMKIAYDNGITIIRLPIDYIYKESLFKKYKQKILDELYERDKPEIIYLCEDDRYDHFKEFNFNGDIIPKIVPK